MLYRESLYLYINAVAPEEGLLMEMLGLSNVLIKLFGLFFAQDVGGTHA